MTTPLCVKNYQDCFARCGKDKHHCSILREMTNGETCSFYKSEDQYKIDARKYPPKSGMRLS